MGKYNIERISQLIRIGWDGENNWRPQTFDCSSLLATRPSGTVTLWILPTGESEAFPVALTADGNLRTWTPLDSELVGGGGKLQFHCQDGEDVGKSPVYRYVVEGSLLTGAEHPDETPSWAVQVVADVQDAIDGIGETVEEMLPDAVEDYMAEHPFVETDPTVPAWAKQPSKPSYTAAEVGAMPSSYVAPVTSVNGQTGDVVVQAGGGAVDSVNGKTGVVVLDAEDVGALPDDTVIPSAVTEQTVSGWGFTKNTGTYIKPSGGIPDSDIASAATWNAKGTYSKPSGGIPKTDLASAVQTSLGKADTALQSHQSLAAYRTSADQDTIDEGQDQAIAAKYTKPASGIPASDLASAVQTSLGKADTALQSHQDISGKADAADVYTKSEVDQKLVGAMDYKGTKATVSALPTSGNKTGDVWHITADGSEWAWNGSAWEELGTAVDLSGYATEQWVENKGYLTQHQSLAAYRTSAAQDTIDAGKANSADLATVATSGSYNDLDDKPSIPSLTGYATQTWVTQQGYLTLADLPIYNGGVS